MPCFHLPIKDKVHWIQKSFSWYCSFEWSGRYLHESPRPRVKLAISVLEGAHIPKHHHKQVAPWTRMCSVWPFHESVGQSALLLYRLDRTRQDNWMAAFPWNLRRWSCFISWIHACSNMRHVSPPPPRISAALPAVEIRAEKCLFPTINLIVLASRDVTTLCFNFRLFSAQAMLKKQETFSCSCCRSARKTVSATCNGTHPRKRVLQKLNPPSQKRGRCSLRRHHVVFEFQAVCVCISSNSEHEHEPFSTTCETSGGSSILVREGMSCKLHDWAMDPPWIR